MEEETIKAVDVTSEEQIDLILERGGIPSSSPKEVDWLYHWWMREFDDEPPIARQVVIVGNDGYAPALCVAVQQAKFVIYRLDEINWWFNQLDEIEEFSSYDQIFGYLKDLVNQDLANWKEWMKRQRGQI
jgi:hypothetical protein